MVYVELFLILSSVLILASFYYKMEITGAAGFSSSKLDSTTLRTSEYDLFSEPRYSNQVVAQDVRYFYPQHMDAERGPFEILITGNGTQFMQMDQMRLELELKYDVKLEDGTFDDLGSEHDASIVPLPASSIFSNIRVKFNHLDVPELSQTQYAYKAYLETLMENTADNNTTYLYPKLGYFDRPGVYQDDDIWKDFGSLAANEDKKPTLYKNDGTVDRHQTRLDNVWLRKTVFMENNPMFFSVPLHLDFLSQHKSFPPNISMSLIFDLNTDEFLCLTPVANIKPRVLIKKMRLAVPVVTLKPELASSILTKWNTKPVNYYFPHVVPRTFHIPANSQYWEEHDISHGILPKSIYFVFVKTANYNGRYIESPFIFENLDLSRFELTLDGQVMNKHTIEVGYNEWEFGECLRAYDHFLRNTKKSREASLITATKFKEDYSIFAFDLTADYNNNYNLYEPQFGDLGVKVQFPALNESYVALVFYVYTKTLSLDKELRVKVSDI